MEKVTISVKITENIKGNIITSFGVLVNKQTPDFFNMDQKIAPDEKCQVYFPATKEVRWISRLSLQNSSKASTK